MVSDVITHHRQKQYERNRLSIEIVSPAAIAGASVNCINKYQECYSKTANITVTSFKVSVKDD
jgi:hypothetical protein